MALIALLRRGGWWIEYYLLYLYVTGSNPGGESFPTLIALNYSLTITQAN